MQSVNIWGGAIVAVRTSIRAHSSLAPAVRTQEGGTALPNATRSPAAETTTMAQPVRRSSQQGPNFIEPSVYHFRSVRVQSGGSVYHLIPLSSWGSGRGTLTINKPRVRSKVVYFANCNNSTAMRTGRALAALVSPQSGGLHGSLHEYQITQMR